MRRSTIFLVLLAALSFFGGLGRGAIADTDEAFYAESAREMVESGNWVTPHFNYEPRFQKPALYYWLTAALYHITGPTEFAARLWSALAGLGIVLLTAAIGRRWFDETTGLLAGAIAATNFGYFALARMALPDLPLAFFISLTIWASLVATLDPSTGSGSSRASSRDERGPHSRRWWMLAAVAAGLGLLMKGPLAIVVPALVVLPLLVVERRSLEIQLTDVILAGMLCVAVAAPWYVVMWLQHGTDYLIGFFVGDNYERFATARFNDPRPWWFYLPVLAGGLLPWTPLVMVWISPIVQFTTRRRSVNTLEVRLLLWALLPLLFFTISIGKQPRYVLPMLPPIAVLLASSILERTREWRRPRRNAAVVAGCSLAGLFLVTLAVLLYRARTLFLDVPAWSTLFVVIAAALGGVTIVVVSWSKAWRMAPAVLSVSAACTFALLPYAALSASSESAVQKAAQLVRVARSPDEAVGTYGVFVRNLVFYSGVKHTDIIHDEHLKVWLSKNPRALIVLPAAEADRLERDQGLPLHRLGELPYFDDGSIRVRLLLWPDPATDIRRVALVRVMPGARFD